jgi:hypothetical protein
MNNTIFSRTDTDDLTADATRHLVELAERGELPKAALADLLAPEPRYLFLDACAQVERDFTHRCGSSGNTCLESGCAVEGEACLEALLKAGPEYHKACARVWLPIFSDPRNRLDAGHA